jgi:hypothetical protein
MAIDPLDFEFHEDARAPVVEHMVVIASEGRGWVNLSPGLDLDPTEAPAPQSVLSAIFSSRGPTVPLATWTPAQGRDLSTVGIQHGEGPKAASLLAELGTPVPEGWRLLQDHPKRGLVVALPPEASASPEGLDRVLVWLLRATGALCSWPRTGEWRALCYVP